MFMGVTEPFTAGQTIPVTLNFQNAGVIQTTLEVRPLEGAPAVADTAAASPAAVGDAAAHGDHGN
jgi:hypothetical protein